MKITLQIPDDIIRNAVGGAAIGYWARESRWSDRANLALVLQEDEPDKGHTGRHLLMRGDWERALVILATKYPKHFADLVGETGDAYTGDILVQCAAFGEEKYA